MKEPVLPEMPLIDFTSELSSNMFIPQPKVLQWYTSLRQLHPSIETCGGLMVLSQDTAAAGVLSDADMGALSVCLGSMAVPFKFPAASRKSRKDREGDEPNTSIKMKKPKGGCTTESAEVLFPRRAELSPGSYFPPQQFDAHRPGLPGRNEGELRRLIVQEVCAVATCVCTRATLFS